jgi:hypothetical protein
MSEDGSVSCMILTTAPRATVPEEATERDGDLAFRVWVSDAANNPDDKLPWKCVACFRYLMECLDFLAYCSKRDVPAVFQSPTGVRRV